MDMLKKCLISKMNTQAICFYMIIVTLFDTLVCDNKNPDRSISAHGTEQNITLLTLRLYNSVTTYEVIHTDHKHN